MEPWNWCTGTAAKTSCTRLKLKFKQLYLTLAFFIFLLFLEQLKEHSPALLPLEEWQYFHQWGCGKEQRGQKCQTVGCVGGEPCILQGTIIPAKEEAFWTGNIDKRDSEQPDGLEDVRGRLRVALDDF